MLKALGILVGGIFVGAVGMEIVHRKCPDVLSKVCEKTQEVTAGLKEGFKKGYENATGGTATATANS